jgi:dipeptidyl aminopeptidase/acylaminoacyl peptidase
VSLLGFSAGGHLALLQGYKYGTPKVKAVIDFFGPTDLVTMYNNPWHQLVPYALQMITGATPQSKPELYRNSSPVNFITPQTPPTLILHGGLDNIVDISQSRLLKTKLDAVGVANELIVYPNERHGWYGSNLTHSFNQVERFLRQNVR